jgi:proteasome lid subunit RPN8/RPN11
MKDVYLKFGCFASILSTVIESYPKETDGFLGGENNKSRVNLEMSPPLQSAKRTEKSVEFKDTKKYNEAKSVIDALGLTIIGGFHSHPRNPPDLSEQDLISAGLENLIKKVNPKSPFMDKWLELVVSIHRRKFQKKFNPMTVFDDSSKKINGKLKIQNNGYDYEMMEYWVNMDEITEDEFFPTVVEIANLNLTRNSFPNTWEFE